MQTGSVTPARVATACPPGHGDEGVDPGVRGKCLLALGSVQYWQLSFAEALECYDHAQQLFGQAGDQAAQAEATYDRAFVLVLLDRYDEGRRAFGEALARYRSLGDARGQANALGGVALSTFVAGDHDRAVAVAEEALDALTRVGNPFEVANATALLATTMRGAGLIDEAERLVAEAIRSSVALGSVAGVAWGLADAAELALMRGDVRRAAVLGGALTTLDDSRYPRVPRHVLRHRALTDLVREHPSCADDWERGRAMTMDEAVELAAGTGRPT